MESFLDEYEKKMTKPRVMIDNSGCSNVTRVMIDSARKEGILLETVQVLTDLDLSIQKAYICSDGRWFMDVFHVTDLNGNKLTDESVINNLEISLCSVSDARSKSFCDLTALELTGTDRLGLLSEVFAVLSNLKCNVVESKVWTHNGRIATQIYINDFDSGCQIKNSKKIDEIKSQLRLVLRGDKDIRSSKTFVSISDIHTERRLHQMMFADRDFERETIIKSSEQTPLVVVQNCLEKGYSVVNIQCKDRIKLLFDIICTLTDMQYIVYHATVNTAANRAYMEFFIRHSDGAPVCSQAEKQRLIMCLQAAIQRRATQGVRLELCTDDRKGLLADVMRTFRENGLNVTRAEISTSIIGTVENIFYVTDTVGNNPDPNIIESVQQIIGLSILKVKELPLIYPKTTETNDSPNNGAGGAIFLSLGKLVMKSIYSLGLTKSLF